MLNLYVVIRAGSFSRHAVDMLSLCVYQDLYGINSQFYSLDGKHRLFPHIVKNLNQYAASVYV